MSVVEFPSQKVPSDVLAERAVVWECVRCDNQTFYLHSSGDVECAGCGNFMSVIRCFCPNEKT